MVSFNHNELQRYSRHFSLPHIGTAGQEILKSSSVLCIGAGGIGSPAIYYLAAAGVGKIGIIDHDHVDMSNLNRQIIYAENDCKKRKAEIAAQKILEFNSHIQVIAYTEQLNHENAQKIVNDYDVIVDGSDNYETRYLVNDVAFFCGKPVISASIYQYTGQLAVFNYNNGPCYRCLYPEPPDKNLIPNCNDSGVLGAVTGIMGSMAAMETIKLLVPFQHYLKETLIIYNALSLDLKKYQITKKSQCILCAGRTLFDDVPRYHQTICASKNSQTVISVNELAAKMKQEKILLIDVRENWEHAINAIPGSINIPLSEIKTIQLNHFDKMQNDSIVLYCKSGQRSHTALNTLLNSGFTNIFNLEGGIDNWLKTFSENL